MGPAAASLLTARVGEAPLPGALRCKCPHTDREWGWQFAFPSARLAVDPETRAIHTTMIHTRVLTSIAPDVCSPPE